MSLAEARPLWLVASFTDTVVPSQVTCTHNVSVDASTGTAAELLVPLMLEFREPPLVMDSPWGVCCVLENGIDNAGIETGHS